MSFLIDTHTILWFTQEPHRLSKEAHRLMEQTEMQKFLSIASIWEIGIKVSIGKLKLDGTPDEFARAQVRNHFQILPIALEHVARAAVLPRLHCDPFDRMLIAQAAVEGLQIITMDASFAPYGVPCIW